MVEAVTSDMWTVGSGISTHAQRTTDVQTSGALGAARASSEVPPKGTNA